jgi:hypothetical protein
MSRVACKAGPNPPQFNSLDAGTTVVSLTIGGNRRRNQRFG